MNAKILPVKPAYARKRNSCLHPKLNALWCDSHTRLWKRTEGSRAWDSSESGGAESPSQNDWARSLLALRTQRCPSEPWISLFIAMTSLLWDRSRSCRKKKLGLKLRTRTSYWSMMFCLPDVPLVPRWTPCFRTEGLGRVQLCVLIDRGHREIPVEATFVGRNVQTTANEVIEVKLTEIDDAEKVLLMER